MDYDGRIIFHKIMAMLYNSNKHIIFYCNRYIILDDRLYDKWNALRKENCKYSIFCCINNSTCIWLYNGWFNSIKIRWIWKNKIIICMCNILCNMLFKCSTCTIYKYILVWCNVCMVFIIFWWCYSTTINGYNVISCT